MDDKQIQKLLNAAANKLGMSPEQLLQAASKGDMNSILSHLDDSSASKVRSAMNDKKITGDIINSFNKNNKQ